VVQLAGGVALEQEHTVVADPGLVLLLVEMVVVVVVVLQCAAGGGMVPEPQDLVESYVVPDHTRDSGDPCSSGNV
jgi:hypothetical protein